jgi:hypothetical protein
VFVLDVSGLEGLCLHNEFEQEASSSKDINRISLKLSFSNVICELRGVAFDRTYPVGHVIDDGLALLIDEVASVTKVDYFDIEFGVQ